MRETLTPELKPTGESVILLLDLGAGRNRLGGSILAQCFGQMGDTAPDLDDPARLQAFFDFIARRRADILAYHDRSDGGLLVTLLEMAFCSRCGLDIEVPEGVTALDYLFNEELGAAIQVSSADRDAFLDELKDQGLSAVQVATLRDDEAVRILSLIHISEPTRRS